MKLYSIYDAKANTYCATAQCSDCQDKGNGSQVCNSCQAYDENGDTTWEGKCTFKN